MNHDEKFKQRWEFRRLEVDGDSSSDDLRSNSSGNPTVKNHKLSTNLVLTEIDTPICQRDDKLEEKKIKTKKPKKCLVKENKRKRKVNPNETVISKDLKIFGDSLIDELKVARENMFAHMRDEMKKLIDSRSKLVKKNVKCSNKTNPRPEAGVKSRNCPRESNASKFPKSTNCPQEGEKPRPSTKTRVMSTVDPNQMVSSSYLTLPTVLQNPQFQNPKNSFPPMNYHMLAKNNSSPGMEIAKLMESVGHKSNSGFPMSLHRVLGNSSNMSTLAYTENLFLNNSKVGPRMNGVRFPNSISSNMAYKSDEEYVSQLARSQRWPVLPTNFINEQ